MVTSKYNGKNFETMMDYRSNDGHTIIFSNNPDSNLVFNFDLFSLEVKDIIGMSKVKLMMSFRHLIDFMILALDCIDYADPQIMNIPSQNTFESYSLVFDYIDESNIHFEVYLRSPSDTILISDVLFDQDSLTGLVIAIQNDYLERNHALEVLARMKEMGIYLA